MLDIFNKKALSQAQAALANTQAKLDSQAKKTKTAAIIGGSTTGAAAVVAGICFFTGGRKINREKIKNFDSVVEERNKSLDEVAGLKAKCAHAEALAVAADGCCFRMAAAFTAGDDAVVNEVKQGHSKIHEEIFGETSQNTVNAAVAAYDEFIKSLNAQNQNNQQPQNTAQNQIPQNAQNAQNDQNAQNAQNDQNAQNAQNDQNAQNAQNDQNDQNAQNAQKIADAQKKYGEACAKAGAAKTAFENAEKKLAAAKASAPDGDHKDLEAAVNTAKAAFDAADKELVDAKSALDALQANQQK